MEMKMGGSHGEPPWLLILFLVCRRPLDFKENLVMMEIRSL